MLTSFVEIGVVSPSKNSEVCLVSLVARNNILKITDEVKKIPGLMTKCGTRLRYATPRQDEVCVCVGEHRTSNTQPFDKLRALQLPMLK